MVFDDGVTMRLAEQHFLMTTTTGGAARVLDWLEGWLQTEWPELRVLLHVGHRSWATVAVVGPRRARSWRQLAPDIDLSNDAFPFMACARHGRRACRRACAGISFSGELAYEINVPAGTACACGRR